MYHNGSVLDALPSLFLHLHLHLPQTSITMTTPRILGNDKQPLRTVQVFKCFRAAAGDASLCDTGKLNLSLLMTCQVKRQQKCV